MVSLSAQDLITKKDGTDIKAKVLEVNRSELKYKLWNNLEGPTYSIDIFDVLLIRYQNGTNEVFNLQNTSSEASSPITRSQVSDSFHRGYFANDISSVRPGMKYKTLKSFYDTEDFSYLGNPAYSPSRAWLNVALPGLAQITMGESGLGARYLGLGTVGTLMWAIPYGDYLRYGHFTDVGIAWFIAGSVFCSTVEVISILLLARSQNFHRNSLVNTSNAVVGKIYEWSSDVGNYFHLNTANEQLAEENAMLRRQLSIVYDTVSSIFDVNEGDTLYEYIPAQVVNNSTNQVNNYIIINKGAKDGIERDMSVISTDGIVGVVTDVSRHYASIMSLLHSKSVVGVRFKSNQEIAGLKWQTNDYRYGIVEDIPTHIVLQKGDTIVTSSHSYIFPEDLMVGTVEEFYPTAVDALNKAKIRFATDFSTLRHVYIIKDLHKPEIDSLKAKFQ